MGDIFGYKAGVKHKQRKLFPPKRENISLWKKRSEKLPSDKSPTVLEKSEKRQFLLLIKVFFPAVKLPVLLRFPAYVKSLSY